MLNDIFYFISEEEKRSIKELTQDLDSHVVTLIKKIDNSGEKFGEKLLILNNQNDVVKQISTTGFTHLVLDRAYEISLDRLH